MKTGNILSAALMTAILLPASSALALSGAAPIAPCGAYGAGPVDPLVFDYGQPIHQGHGEHGYIAPVAHGPGYGAPCGPRRAPMLPDRIRDLDREIRASLGDGNITQEEADELAEYQDKLLETLALAERDRFVNENESDFLHALIREQKTRIRAAIAEEAAEGESAEAEMDGSEETEMAEADTGDQPAEEAGGEVWLPW